VVLRFKAASVAYKLQALHNTLPPPVTSAAWFFKFISNGTFMIFPSGFAGGFNP
jgi:hypothetical protein